MEQYKGVHSLHSDSVQCLKTGAKQEKQLGKEERIHASLFADDIILYVRSPKVSIDNLLELINMFSKEIGYKVNTQK